MKILCTLPGHYGDILWMLPTVRALAEQGHEVDCLLSQTYGSLQGLISHQPYVREVVVDSSWVITHGGNEPRVPPGIAYEQPYDRVFHLGYEGWPQDPLPKQVEHQVHLAWKDADGPVPVIDLTRPWITPSWTFPCDLAIGFSDNHFELKYGLLSLLWDKWYLKQKPEDNRSLIWVGNSPRWNSEPYGCASKSWEMAAAWIAGAPCFLGCCAALHVLAIAIGTPVILMEPMEARHNPIFYPLGTRGPQVTQVLGLDGNWTWDARHVADEIEKVWARRATCVS
jgi:hypothetical protein